MSQVDNLKDMLTFEKSTIDNFVTEYKGIPSTAQSSWGNWPIDNSGGLLSILGKKDRTPGEYKDLARHAQDEEISVSKTCESFHPMVLTWKEHLDHWRPRSLEGLIRPEGAETRWKFRKDDSKFIPEDDVIVAQGKRQIVLAYPEGDTVRYCERESLSKELSQDPEGTSVPGSSNVPKR
jgi:hypothetical protein